MLRTMDYTSTIGKEKMWVHKTKIKTNWQKKKNSNDGQANINDYSMLK